MIKAIIFDLDGVIIESADIKTRAFRKLFEQDYPDKVNTIVDYHLHNMGVSRYVKLEYIYENILRRPLAKEKEEGLGKKFSNIVLEKILNAPFVPGALEFLKENYKKYALFIASGTPQEELNYIVKKRGLSDYFQEIHGSPPGKTEIIRDILSKNRWLPREVVFIGDAETDLRAAYNTGLNFIARVNPGYEKLQDCQYNINSLCNLEAILNSLGNPSKPALEHGEL